MWMLVAATLWILPLVHANAQINVPTLGIEECTKLCPQCQKHKVDIHTDVTAVEALRIQWYPFYVDVDQRYVLKPISCSPGVDSGTPRCSDPMYTPKMTWDFTVPTSDPSFTIKYTMAYPMHAQLFFENWCTSGACATVPNMLVAPMTCRLNYVNPDKTELELEPCALCIPQQSHRNGLISNGYYMSDFLISGSYNNNLMAYGDTSALTRPCEPGTWNTCQTTTACDYPAQYINPTSQNPERYIESNASWYQRVTLTPSDIHINANWGTLVGSCYPCYQARGRQHAGIILTSVGPDYTTRNYLPFYCPGGAAVPVECNKGNKIVALMDPATKRSISGCLCDDMYYEDDQGNCQPCLPGYYCVARNMRMLPCPKGTYSTGGATACTPCNTDPCPDVSKARTSCTGLGNTKNSECVSCTLCNELGCIGSDCRHCYAIFG